MNAPTNATALLPLTECGECTEAALAIARGTYQRGIVLGHESWSGAGLQGRAASYGGRYAISRGNLLSRLRNAGIPVEIEIGQHGRLYLAVDCGHKNAPLIAYKLLALPYDTPRSIYDASQWRLGVERCESLQPGHRGGLYAYATIAEALRAELPDGSRLQNWPHVVVRCTTDGRAIRYGAGKLAYGRITPVGVVARKASEQWVS